MRLAAHTAIKIDGVAATLRPTLRAAYLLEQKHGFQALLHAVDDCDLTVISDIVEYSATSATTLPALLTSIEQNGAICLYWLKPALTSFIASLIGADDEDASTEGEKMTFAAFYERLFAIGTGWLGWTPEATWNATPAEILAAHAGRIELLQAMFGSADKAEDENATYESGEDITVEDARAGIAELRALAGQK